MSRRRPRERSGDLPAWLATYSPELWAEDLEDPLQVHYFGRVDWRQAQQEWAAGGQPEAKIQIPQTRRRGERQYVSGSQEVGGGKGPQGPTNHPPRFPVARPIKLH